MRLKNYNDYSESYVDWIGDIPDHWEITRLQHIVDIKRGASPRPIDDPEYFDDNGIYGWVRISDVTRSEKYLYFTDQKLSTLGSLKSVKLDAEHLIVSISGSVGKPIINKIQCCIHDGFVVFKNPKVDINFLYYCFFSKRPYLGLGQLGTQFNLNSTIMKNIPIPVPPFDEISYIVRYLEKYVEKIDVIISKKQQLISLLEEKRLAIITQAVTKGLDPNVPLKDSGIEWFGEIPEHWEIFSLKRIANIMPSGVDKKTKDDEFPVRLCNYTDVYYKEEIIDTQDFMKATASINEIQKFKLQKGDVIITKDSEIPDDIAVPAYVPQDLDVICGYHLTLLRSNKNKIIGEFLFRSIQSSLVNQQYSSVAYGITRYMISIRGTGSVLLSIPPIEEQKIIVEYIRVKVNTIELLKGKISTQIDLFKEYKQALITNAVTGKIDVREYDS